MSRLEDLDPTALSAALGVRMRSLARNDAPACDDAATRDALHALARLNLRHCNPERALILLLVALHIAPPTRSLLCATAAAFLGVGNPEQALAALDRVARDFGETRENAVLRARTVMRLEGLSAGRIVMARALTLAPETGS